MCPDQRQINQKVYKKKMNILLKILLITFASTILLLMVFDYDSTKNELALSSQINCISLGQQNTHKYVCNTCFKVNPKDKVNQKIQIQSSQPFLHVSLKPEISGIFTCEEWLQAIDYQTVKNQTNRQQSLLRFQPSVNKFLKTLQNQHNQILLTQKSQKQSQQPQQIFTSSSSLNRPYQVVSFYSKSKEPSVLRIFQSNQNIKSTGTHILTLLTVAISIALLYVFHCVDNKKAVQKYNQHIFSVIGIFGTFLWIIFGDLMGNYGLYLSFTKIILFSAVFDIVFGAGRWIFFGIILITELLSNLVQFQTDFYRYFFDLVFLLIITGKILSQAKKQNFYFQKNSNKKIYFLVMTFLVLSCTVGSNISQDETKSQIFQFLIGYWCIVSFTFGVKNLDGNEYQKLLKEQIKNNKNQFSTTQQTLPSTTIYEDHEQIQHIQLQKQGRK